MADQTNILNSLRNLINPADNVSFELNLNRHPKNHKNKSLSYALNMGISDDGTVLENDESLLINKVINYHLLNIYQSEDYKIIHIIPCNTELVIFVKRPNISLFDIWRYREKDNIVALFYDKGIIYNNGQFSSTFTYTSNDSLIIAFCEYPEDDNSQIMNPMMTINLGTFTNGQVVTKRHWKSSNNEFNDRELEPYKLPLQPEVTIPQIINVGYENYASYQGTYIIYIRFKINEYDYTQWYNFGFPIVNNITELNKIYVKRNTNSEDKDESGNECFNAHATNYPYDINTIFSKKSEIINNSISILIHTNNVNYEYVQIGCICKSKTYTKYFRTKDIKYNNDINVILANNNLIEEEFNILSYENYFNVKNIINKQNKLYISNYKSIDDSIDYSSFANNVKLNLCVGEETNISDYINNTKSFYNFTFNGINFDSRYLFVEPILTHQFEGDYKFIGKEIDYKFVSIALYLKRLGLENFLTNNIKVYRLEYESIGKKYEWNSKGVFDIRKCFIAVSTDYEFGVLQYDELKNGSITIEQFYENYLTKKAVAFLYIDDIEIYLQKHAIGNFGRIYYQDEYQWDDRSITNNGDKRADIRGFKLVNDNNQIIIEDHFNSGDTWDYADVLKEFSYTNINSLLYNVNRYNTIQTNINNYLKTSLIPGEIYDFYIHYIDKYGNSTKGYQLQCKDNLIKYNVNGQLVDGCIIRLTQNVPSSMKDNERYYERYYIFPNIPILQNNDLNISQEYIKELKNNIYNNDIYDTYDDIGTATYKTILNSLKNLKYLHNANDLYWSDIADNWIFKGNLNHLSFIPYINSNGIKLFKVPKIVNFIGYYNDPNDNSQIIEEHYNFNYSLNIKVTNNILPTGYVGYFISAKKHEKTYVLNGIGNEAILMNELITVLRANDLCGNIIKTYKIDINNDDIINGLHLDINDSSKRRINSVSAINGINVAYAGESQKNRLEKGSCIYTTNEFTDVNISSDELNYVELMNINKSIYTEDNDLYRIGNINYNLNEIINDGYNGVFGKSHCFKYGTDTVGVSVCQTDKGRSSFGNVFCASIYGYYENVSPFLYLDKTAKYYRADEIFYEYIETLGLYNNLVVPVKDLDIILYQKFKKLQYKTIFNRTVYRSNVISDESRQNNWRFFETDAYRNIEENKGNITNLLSIGTFLYIHTEHSLFAFNNDNSLSMNNQQLQVATPDIFDTEYKEQFNTLLGYGGLQTKDSWIAGTFGYIYFNRDANELIDILSNSMNRLDDNMYEFIQLYKPTNILFANDIKHNRIFVKLINKTNSIYLSYNYKYKKFVSFHNINFDKSYNTKDNLYLLYNNYIYQFKDKEYGINEKVYHITNNNGIFEINYKNTNKNNNISFIINRYYSDIKYLENITYKLRQRSSDIITHPNILNYIEYPVEKNIIPYSGDKLRIFNDFVDTGELNILVNDATKNKVTDYEKPYYNLGNWNYNNIRDIFNSTKSIGDEMSRIYGNYFIISFTFENQINHIEFENLNVNLTQDKQ